MQSYRCLSFGQKALSYTKSRFLAGVLSQATATIGDKQRKLDVQYAATPPESLSRQCRALYPANDV